ncbi:outer membrane protein assembly factor BamE [Shewanella eurypsychrophilus]|uniref:Outer membrane protein assembly factor BamE n=1 Tax=Shewanella eurypsychrophilus TaxID=2593656 RepID=A0ABX6VAE6_9GAMM|nr:MULTISPECIES: outer membrane protein assembly factor BamE [Shewanella]QFU23576.1 outer membrane protein assembly factor BamE [Shewanella sp. YLB-09]QPG58800.1 outer membrane protein assembly factor BamE [Shewanella eurypsychrophilus]
MTIKKKSLTLLGAAALSLSMTGCSVFDWLIYKPDIPQGNYMETQQVEKLRVEMTKEQVEYILGRPVLRDSFSDDTWYYVYHYKSGRDASIIHKELIIHFDNDLLTKVVGDYDLAEDFSTPLDQSRLPDAPSIEAELETEITAENTEEPLIPEQRPEAKPLIEEDDPESQAQKKFE